MVICLQVHVVFRSCYHILQVHVSPRSDVTFGNDVTHHNSTTKTGSKMILHTTDVDKFLWVLLIFIAPK